MSRSVFEYFLEPEELGPHYCEFISRSVVKSRPVANSNRLENGKEKQHKSVSTRDPNLNEFATPCALSQVRESSNVPFRTEAPSTHQTCNVLAEPLVAMTKRNGQESSESVMTESEMSHELQPESDSEFNSERSHVRQFLSVHAFGQFVFCQRAGILAAESHDETDPNEPSPRLTFLPNFDREKIEEMLSSNLQKGLMGTLYISAMIMFLIVGIVKQNQMLVSPLLILLSVSLVWEFCVVATVVRLVARRRIAIKAEARSPDPDVTGLQQVNWWSMLNAGFEPVNYQRPFRHPDIPLEGCPWRVLERDSFRIPVIRAGGNRLGNREGELFPKYHAKIVAYAVLLESINQVEVPYGLIFPHDSPHGLAVPITAKDRERVRETLTEFIIAMDGSQQRQLEPALPENRNRCDGCSIGKPEPISKREIETRRKSGSKLVVLHDYYGETYQCQCSNRFGTVPPHRDSAKLRLVAAIE